MKYIDSHKKYIISDLRKKNKYFKILSKICVSFKKSLKLHHKFFFFYYNLYC